MEKEKVSREGRLRGVKEQCEEEEKKVPGNLEDCLGYL